MHPFTKFKAFEFDVLICVSGLSIHSYIKKIKLTATKFLILQSEIYNSLVKAKPPRLIIGMSVIGILHRCQVKK